MKKVMGWVAVALLVGCGSSPEPKKVELTVNGQPVAMAPPKAENNPEKAASQLATQKAKWLDESGELKEGFRRGTSNKLMASDSFKQIADNHPDTPAGKEAKGIADKLAQ